MVDVLFHAVLFRRSLHEVNILDEERERETDRKERETDKMRERDRQNEEGSESKGEKDIEKIKKGER